MSSALMSKHCKVYQHCFQKVKLKMSSIWKEKVKVVLVMTLYYRRLGTALTFHAFFISANALANLCNVCKTKLYNNVKQSNTDNINYKCI